LGGRIGLSDGLSVDIDPDDLTNPIGHAEGERAVLTAGVEHTRLAERIDVAIDERRE
jgi:hypothetical protein